MTSAPELGGQLLQGVSRSFYLTLKALPHGVREPLSLAYLLARAADTMADTTRVGDDVRLECLREFGRLVQSEARDPLAEMALCERMQLDFAALQTDASEAALLQRLGDAFEAFRQAPASHQAAMRGVLGPIVHGQMRDIERFPADGQVRALSTAQELDDYTWLVAGCVGEFWTKLCAQEVTEAFSNEMPLETLVEWGIRYGKGLQLVNILRDVAKDLRMGRCYFPETELAAHGLTVTAVQAEPSLLLPLMAPWRERCREHLLCGLRYLDTVTHKRLLYATSLPLLLGVRTLAAIELADWPTLAAGVKVSRAEVSKLLVDAGFAILRKNGIRRMAEQSLGAVGPS
ncbi:MAG: squalene/phytoene synthase family protein [Roseimicrobium sp.]